MTLINLLKKHFKEALLKSLVGTVLFLFIHILYNIEFIRDNFEDVAFDFVNYSYLSTKYVNNKNVPQVNLLQIDHKYLKEEKLIDKDNILNYGYLFPRDKIAKIINKIDKLKLLKQPKAILIDYEMSYTSMPYSKNLSKEDKILLETLKNERDYKILIPKTSKYNFIECSNDINIQDLIKKNKIIFVSVVSTIDKDNITRRYKSSEFFNDKEYIYAPIALWLIYNNKYTLENFKKKNFKTKDIIENRIIIKKNKEKVTAKLKNKESAIFQKNYWKNLSIYSANYPLNGINTSNSIIIIGSNHNNINDFFNVNDLNVYKISGMELMSNALMTIFYFDGSLKILDLRFSIALIFILFFIVDIILKSIFDKYNIKSKKFEFIIFITVITIIMLFVSIFLILYFKVWFNWFVPVLLFKIYDFIKIIKVSALKQIFPQ